MIDIKSESLVTLSVAANSLPGNPHPSTLQRWRVRGIHGVRLETVLVGGIRYTSDEALQRFIEATTAAADGELIRGADLDRLQPATANLGGELPGSGI